MVKSVLENLGIEYVMIELGEVEIKKALTEFERDQLKAALHASGLELMDDKKAILVEKIKNVIIEMIHYEDELPYNKFSEYLSDKLKVDYKILSSVFSKVKGITIEHYIVLHKIEKVKELLIYDELSVKEIAILLHYSSPAHLCNQFKKVTGLTPTFFKTIKENKRKHLEDL
jgi:AraC-like DNA-binding protein